MAGDWIKMRTNLDTDPAVVRISSGLKQDRFCVVGRLHKIWSWANEHLTDGLDVPIDSDFLDALVESPGFSDQLRRVGWLSGRDGNLCFPNFQRHNGASAKVRAQDASRKKAARKTSEKCPDGNRTESGPEKRREEKNKKAASPKIEFPCDGGQMYIPTESAIEAWRFALRNINVEDQLMRAKAKLLAGKPKPYGAVVGYVSTFLSNEDRKGPQKQSDENEDRPEYRKFKSLRGQHAPN